MIHRSHGALRPTRKASSTIWASIGTAVIATRADAPSSRDLPRFEPESERVGASCASCTRNSLLLLLLLWRWWLCCGCLGLGIVVDIVAVVVAVVRTSMAIESLTRFISEKSGPRPRVPPRVPSSAPMLSADAAALPPKPPLLFRPRVELLLPV